MLEDLVNFGFKEESMKQLYFNSYYGYQHCLNIGLGDIKVNYKQNGFKILGILFAESVSNAYDHGGKEADIFYSCEGDVFRLAVFDCGDGFDRSKISDPRLDKNLMNERGRGLLMLENYSDVLKYNEKGNNLFLLKNINEEC